MHHLEFEPGGQLRNAIKCFWYDRIDFGDQLSGFEVVPDGYAEIIFHFGEACSILAGGSLQPLTSPFMIGLLDHPVYFYSKNTLHIIAVRCYPWTVFDVLGLPSGKGGVRNLEHPLAGLQTVLSNCINNGAVDKAISHVQQYFFKAQPVSGNATVIKAGAAMRGANGMIPVSQVADAAHATVRTLERKFRQSSGYTVKDVSGLMRFEQVRNRLLLDPGCNLAGLAHELGYTDQSHLSREFKRYSGSTPAAFARKAKKEPGADGNDFAAFAQL